MDQVDQVDRVEEKGYEEEEDPEGKVYQPGPAWKRGDR